MAAQPIAEARPIATALIHHYEQCHRRRRDGKLDAYPDPYSPLGKWLRAKGYWHPYLRGDIEIPPQAGNLSGAPWTIGWGQTGRDVFRGVVWTQATADARSATEITRVMHAIATVLLKRTATAPQLAALTSFAYNVGLDIDEDTKAEGLGDSTLLRLFNAGDIAGAARQFDAWVNAGGVKRVPGLVRRRAHEKKVFLGGAV